ncbi:MAG TPA: MBL fold metallo-hydrolase [Nitrosospira sp.]|jgi:L-ascorbate metabolism protein UlaG (beta-lactamase superfamily)|nr:MBL fold metallo-hydrolase [Nitrosospira sp.]
MKTPDEGVNATRESGGSKYILALPVSGEEERPEGQKDAERNEEQNAQRRDSGSIIFVGTATVIIRYAGLTVLTDPNFLHRGDHVHLGYGLTSKRLTNPAIELENLPPVDLIVLSHMHEDHFDRFVQKNLDRNIPIVTTSEAGEILKELGFMKLYPLKTWETFTVEKGSTALSVTSMPGRHGPPVVAKLLPEVMGSILDFGWKIQPRRYRIYISGDTMVFKDIHEIPQRYPGVDMALLHLGGTRLLGLVTVTMDAKEGIRMMRIIVPKKAIPIHYNDYDVFKSPLSDFEKEIEQAGLRDKVVYLKHGDQYEFYPDIR